VFFGNIYNQYNSNLYILKYLLNAYTSIFNNFIKSHLLFKDIMSPKKISLNQRYHENNIVYLHISLQPNIYKAFHFYKIIIFILRLCLQYIKINIIKRFVLRIYLQYIKINIIKRFIYNKNIRFIRK